MKELPWMDVTKMMDTRVSSGCCACCMTSSGGQEWPNRCRGQSATASDASSMNAVMPKPQCNPSLLLHLWSCYMLTLPALRQWWSWTNPQMWWAFVFCNYFMKHIIAYVTTNQTVKTVAKFLWQGYISIFKAPAKLTRDWGVNFKSNIIRESFASLWEYKRLGLHHTMILPMDRWNKLTKHWCRW